MTILSNTSRVGNFSSSEIYKLLSIGSRLMTDEELAEHKRLNPKSKKTTIADGLGEAALTYIAEKNMARRLGRSLTSETNARPTTWGKLLEPFAFNKLGFDYDLVSTETITHPDYPFWVGSPDVIGDATAAGGGKIVGDHKCPMTLKSFCQLVDPLYDGLSGMDAINAIRNGWVDSKGFNHPPHPDGEKYFQQLVSNSILTKAQYAELIVYVPFRSDLPEIRLTAMDDPKFKWVEYADDWELPFLIEGGYYSDLNIIHFEVPQFDKDYLTDCVERAGKLLI